MRISPFALSYLRHRTEELLDDRCMIVRFGAQPVAYNSTTRSATVASGQTVYTGACRLWEVPAGSPTMLADEELTFAQLNLTLPWNSQVPERDDQVWMTASGDPTVVGRSLKILGIVRSGGLRGSRIVRVEYIDSSKESW